MPVKPENPVVTECTHCRRQYPDGVRFCPVDGFAAVPVGDPLLGRQLGQFQLIAACGQGATGTVYRAMQTTVGRVAAVKVLRADLLQDPNVLKRFLREAKAGAQLCHPNIATVFQADYPKDGVPYIAMEYVEGLPLSALLDAGPPGLPRVFRIAEQIASALAEAHDKGVIHRDLKPENILLTERRGEGDIVKIVDFGIAKIVADGLSADSQISRIGTVFGTPHYIAPEQASGSEIDHRADLYSLGCILFQMTTGRVPFVGTSGIQVLVRHLREAPPSPRALNPQVPEALEALILRLLAKSPEARPQTGEALLFELQALKEALQIPTPRAISGVRLLPACEPAPLATAANGVGPAGTNGKLAEAALPIDLSEVPAEGPEKPIVLPLWRRYFGVGLGLAALGGLLVGTFTARGCQNQKSLIAASAVPSSQGSSSAALLTPSPLGGAAAPVATAAAEGRVAAAGPHRPQPPAEVHRSAAHKPPAKEPAARPVPAGDDDDDNLPETIFPAKGPPRFVEPDNAAPAAPAAPLVAPSASVPAPAPAPEPAPPKAAAPAATEPGPPASTSADPPRAAPPPADPSPPKPPPSPPEDDEERRDPYQNLR